MEFALEFPHYHGSLKGSSLISLTRSIKWPRASMRSCRFRIGVPIAEDCYCPLRAGFKPTGHEYLKFGVSGVLRMLESDRPNDLRRESRDYRPRRQ